MRNRTGVEKNGQEIPEDSGRIKEGAGDSGVVQEKDFFGVGKVVFLTIGETARILRVTTRTVRKMIEGGKIRGYQVAWKVLIRRVELESFVKKCRILGK